MRLKVPVYACKHLRLCHACETEPSVLPHLSHRKLHRLNMSSIPSLQNPGLVRILMEEMLPHCLVTGAEYSQGLSLEDTTQTITTHSSTDPGAQPQEEESGQTSAKRQGQMQ